MGGLEIEVENRIRSVFVMSVDIDSVVLYGSRAKGNFKHGSDIDLALFGNNLTLETIYKLYDALDELYLPYKFDLTIFDAIESEELKEHIRRVGISFFERM